MSVSAATPLEMSRDDRALELEEAVTLRRALEVLGALRDRHNRASFTDNADAARAHARVGQAFDVARDVLSDALISAHVYLDSELADYALGKYDEAES